MRYDRVVSFRVSRCAAKLLEDPVSVVGAGKGDILRALLSAYASSLIRDEVLDRVSRLGPMPARDILRLVTRVIEDKTGGVCGAPLMLSDEGDVEEYIIICCEGALTAIVAISCPHPEECYIDRVEVSVS